MKKSGKLTAGAVAACIAALITLAALIVYQVNIGAEGYFKGASVSNLIFFSILAIAMYLVVILLSTISLNGAADTCRYLVIGLLQIGAPVLTAYCLIQLIAARVEGLGFIYFSNADVTLEVQTAENLSSSKMAIASMVLYGIALVVGLAAAFFSLRKKEK